jgi:hypothetical protein
LFFLFTFRIITFINNDFLTCFSWIGIGCMICWLVFWLMITMIITFLFFNMYSSLIRILYFLLFLYITDLLNFLLGCYLGFCRGFFLVFLIFFWGCRMIRILCNLGQIYFKVMSIKIVKHCLIFHQLYLKVLISFVMICYQIVDCFE